MHRRVLIAEQADTLRSVAETILRQNGYDVIAVTAAEKAREVMELSRPDIIIIGADMAAPDGSPYYEHLREDPAVNRIPMLLFEPANKAATSMPDEVVIPRPFDPADLLHRVSVFLGGPDARREAPAAAVPVDASGVDDEFLNAALGLDRLDVTESEVMNQTGIGRASKSQKAKEKLIGLDANHDLDDSDTGVATIDSLVIDEDSSQIVHRPVGRTMPAPDSTGKIEILTDQYGLTESELDDDPDAAHDYDWFVDAMKKDHDPAAAKADAGLADSGKLTFSDPSAAVDPITPGPSPRKRQSGGGVEQFIDEFKKEMEQVRSAENDPSLTLPPEPPASGSTDNLAWEEKLEQIGPAQVDLFAKELAHELGQKLAEIIAAKIDPEKLLALIKAEIVEQYRKTR